MAGFHNWQRVAAISGAVLCAGPSAAALDRFPTRPIVMIMPTPPGGGTDILGRQLAKAAEKHLGQQIVVENKPGGNGTIGIGQLVQSKPDGYTIGAIWSGAVTTTPHTMQLPYDADRRRLICRLRARRFSGQFRKRIDRPRQGESGKVYHRQ
jgi:tripartite-type tricarboxylate transporter receptor subunit TctC